MYSIEVKNLSRHFGKFTAVDSINFNVDVGEIFGFLGPNGAGKSTTIRMLCGLIKPSSGTALVGGYDILHQTDEVKKNIGYMSQKFSLYEDLSVEENINFYGGIYGLQNEELRQRKSWILKMSDLEGREKSITKTLAGGWKQRLALGCAILHKPKIVFLDEPTAGVDPVSRRKFWELIDKLAEEGTTVFVTTHYLDEAEYCHRLGMIFNGKIKAIGSPGELKRNLEAFAIYEVNCSNPIEAMEILDKEKWIRETSIFGTAFHASTLGIDRGEETIASTLISHGINVINITKTIPSLEDVFIHFTTEAQN
jgi:ABC-2 type transport system ATP-binding protein